MSIKPRFSYIVSIVALLSIAASCSSGYISGGYGTVTVQYAPAVGSRGLADAWPMGGIPVFSSVTVGVTNSEGNEVALDSQPVASGNSVTLRVQAGSGLRVDFEGVPDWDATATAYPAYATVLPTLATGYGGQSEAFSVAAGETASVTVRLSVSSTKIMIPNPNGNWQLNTADSIDSTTLGSGIQLGGLYEPTFKFDRYGTLYLTRDMDGSYAVEAYTSLSHSSTIHSTESFMFGGIALDEQRDRLLYTWPNDGYFPAYIDLSTDTPTGVDINLPSVQLNSYIDPAIAVDPEGFIYVAGTNDSLGDRVIVKLSVGAPSEGSVEAVVIAQATFEALGLRYSANYDGAGAQNYQLSVQDMWIRDGVLYVLANDIDTPTMSIYLDFARSKGKVIAVSASTMTKLWEAGWAGDGVNYPTSDGTQFYGPTRIVGIAPKKLYIIDEGGVFDSNSYAYLDKDRVVELDTESGSITKVGLEGQSSFFANYSSYNIC